MAWVQKIDSYWHIDWKNIIFNKLVRITYCFNSIIDFLNTDMVSVINCIIGISLAMAKSMPKSMQEYIHNLFFLFFIFGMILATILVSKIWQLGVSKICLVNNLTTLKLGIRIAYFLYVIFYQVVKKNYQVVKKWHDKCKS